MLEGRHAVKARRVSVVSRRRDPWKCKQWCSRIAKVSSYRPPDRPLGAWWPRPAPGWPLQLTAAAPSFSPSWHRPRRGAVLWCQRSTVFDMQRLPSYTAEQQNAERIRKTNARPHIRLLIIIKIIIIMQVTQGRSRSFEITPISTACVTMTSSEVLCWQAASADDRW